MSRNIQQFVLVTVATCLASWSPIRATALTIAGFTFPEGEEAFADDAFIAEGVVTGFTEEEVRQRITGSDVGPGFRVIHPDEAVIEVLFTDNAIVNQSGTDLVIFERSGALGAGIPDPRERFGVSIFNGFSFSPFVNFDPVDTGFSASGGTLNLFVVEIDLAAFGIPAGASTDRLRIHLFDNLAGTRSADPTALGALHSAPVPEPATGALLAIGLAILRVRPLLSKAVVRGEIAPSVA
jgi:hypothetical protein